jgi:hypothetical protein
MTADARVVVHPGAVAEVEVRAFHTTVGAYAAGVEAIWQRGDTLAITPGEARTADASHPLESGRRRQVEELLGLSVPPEPEPKADPVPAPQRNDPPHATRPYGTHPLPTGKPAEPPAQNPQIDLTPRAPQIDPALGGEAQLLAKAMQADRLGQPTHALELLDERDRRFGVGTLGPEATLLRVRSLRRVSRDGEALELLDHLPPPMPALAYLERAELRVAAGRIRDALSDYQAVLKGHDEAAAERALYGRAMCEERLGLTEAARDDFKQLVLLYPDGTFIDAARRALSK